MKLIDKGYAKIFCDDDYEIVSKLISGEDFGDILNKYIVDEYYKSPEPGFLQWNFYLLIDKNKLDEKFHYIGKNDKYIRVILVDLEYYGNWDTYMDLYYHDFKEDHDCSMTVYTSNNYAYLSDKVKELNLNPAYCHDSLVRNYDYMTVITALDNIRREILEDDEHVFFITHNQWELSMLMKKFSFLGNKFKIIEL